MNAERVAGAEFVFRFLVGAAAVVVILAGMRASTGVLVPFLLALFITVLATPPFFWLKRQGIHSILALLVMVIVIASVFSLGGALINNSIRDFLRKMPDYQAKFSVQVQNTIIWLNEHGMEVSQSAVSEQLNPAALFQYTGTLLSAASGVLGQTAIVLLVVIFMLFEAAILPRKIRSLSGIHPQTYEQLERAVLNVRSYMGIKTLMSLLTGFLVFVLLMVMGIDYAILLGVTAFLLNFIPNIGSFMAAVPGVALALLDHGTGAFVVTTIGYTAINVGVSNFVEPRFLGRGLGLSTLVVILSLIFWGWILGPVGMLLSVPLTMVLKIALESVETTRWIGVLMGGVPEAASTDKPG